MAEAERWELEAMQALAAPLMAALVQERARSASEAWISGCDKDTIRERLELVGDELLATHAVNAAIALHREIMRRWSELPKPVPLPIPAAGVPRMP
jgi:hypothetical protein